MYEKKYVVEVSSGEAMTADLVQKELYYILNFESNFICLGPEWFLRKVLFGC